MKAKLKRPFPGDVYNSVRLSPRQAHRAAYGKSAPKTQTKPPCCLLPSPVDTFLLVD